MRTRTRQTMRRSTRFPRATAKTRMVIACCGLLLWSAVSAHAATALNGIATNGILVNGVISNGLAVNGLASNGIGTNGISTNGILRNAQPSQAEMPPGGQRDSLPFHSLSQRALGKASVLAGSDGQPPLPVELPEVR
jgi:GLTT repeat (6 copies)